MIFTILKNAVLCDINFLLEKKKKKEAEREIKFKKKKQKTSGG